MSLSYPDHPDQPNWAASDHVPQTGPRQRAGTGLAARPRAVASLVLTAAVVLSLVVSIRIGTFEFFWVVTVPLVAIGLLSWWFGSWMPVAALAGVYVYLVLFWMVGEIAQFLDQGFTDQVVAATGISRWMWRFGLYLGLWLMFVIGCELVLDRLGAGTDQGAGDRRDGDPPPRAEEF